MIVLLIAGLAAWVVAALLALANDRPTGRARPSRHWRRRIRFSSRLDTPARQFAGHLIPCSALGPPARCSGCRPKRCGSWASGFPARYSRAGSARRSSARHVGFWGRRQSRRRARRFRHARRGEFPRRLGDHEPRRRRHDTRRGARGRYRAARAVHARAARSRRGGLDPRVHAPGQPSKQLVFRRLCRGGARRCRLPEQLFVGLLLLIGFGAKIGLLPFYEWFPGAYGAGSGATGAILSGVVLNAAFFALSRGLSNGCRSRPAGPCRSPAFSWLPSRF